MLIARQQFASEGSYSLALECSSSDSVGDAYYSPAGSATLENWKFWRWSLGLQTEATWSRTLPALTSGFCPYSSLPVCCNKVTLEMPRIELLHHVFSTILD